MRFRDDDARGRFEAFTRVGSRALVGLDFDGTLSQIVADPADATAYPGAAAALADLAEHVLAVAIVTGRPARDVVSLGRFDELGRALTARGQDLMVCGQYGFERWSASEPRVVSPRPPRGLGRLMSELPALLARADAEAAHVEEKGLAVAVHTRRLADPQAALDRLRPILAAAAQRHGLEVEPGRLVLELRSGEMDKGRVMRQLLQQTSAEAVCFVGDDLGDLAAFDAVDDLAGSLPALKVCSASGEEQALRERADIVVDGPAGVVAFCHDLSAAVAKGAT